MKNILITGSNGYIGSSFIEWMESNDNLSYRIETISLKNKLWETKNFSKFDVVLHLAAVVHSPSASTASYYSVNRDLTINFAKIAKKHGVKHFIFFSTLSVYGLSSGVISKTTRENPSSDYGKSKLEAEMLLLEMESPSFKVTIVRPPIVYGQNAPGNFNRLIKVFNWLPIFPAIKNQRSMVFIDTLSSFLYVIIQKNLSGIYIPQNKEYISTLSLYLTYRKLRGKHCIIVPVFSFDKLISTNSLLNKIFGSLIVDQNMSVISTDYQSMNFEHTLSTIVKGKIYE